MPTPTDYVWLNGLLSGPQGPQGPAGGGGSVAMATATLAWPSSTEIIPTQTVGTEDSIELPSTSGDNLVSGWAIYYPGGESLDPPSWAKVRIEYSDDGETWTLATATPEFLCPTATAAVQLVARPAVIPGAVNRRARIAIQNLAESTNNIFPQPASICAIG